MDAAPLVYLVDDDSAVLDALSLALQKRGFTVRAFAGAEEFIADYRPATPCCLVLDLKLAKSSGLELQNYLRDRGLHVPVIFISGHSSTASTVSAIKGGAVDFLDKPVDLSLLTRRIKEAFAEDASFRQRDERRQIVLERFRHLTGREREIMRLLVAESSPSSSKTIARQLRISHRTVESHRARIMEKMQAQSLADLASMASYLDEK